MPKGIHIQTRRESTRWHTVVPESLVKLFVNFSLETWDRRGRLEAIWITGAALPFFPLLLLLRLLLLLLRLLVVTVTIGVRRIYASGAAT